MSGENVEIVRRMYAAFNRGNTAAALELFDPDVVVDASRRVDGGVGRGRERLGAIVRSWVGTWDEWSEEIEEMRDLGRQVFVVLTQSGRGRGSGVEVTNRYAVLYEIQGDKITRMTMYRDAAEALEAAGLSE